MLADSLADLQSNFLECQNMASSRRRIRSRSSRFLGALIGTLLFLLYAAATGGLGQDPTSNSNILLLVLGVLIVGGAGA